MAADDDDDDKVATDLSAAPLSTSSKISPKEFSYAKLNL